MKISGIISEYNPFHNGHKYHIEKTKELAGTDDIVVVMSGNFVQRGEPSIADKWLRAKWALLNGAGLVIELPTIFSTATAETFAYASVRLLNDTGIIKYISFGSESGNISDIKKAASILTNETGAFSENIKKHLLKGLSFASARQAAMEETYGNDFSFMAYPNNILAVEYLKAINKLNSPILPLTVSRLGEGYNSLNIAENASATAIRKAISEGKFKTISSSIPENVYETLSQCISNGSAPIYFNNFFQSLLYILRTSAPEKLSKISGITEGLENRIIKAFELSGSIEEASALIKSKRYAQTSIQRALLHILLNINEDDVNFYKKGVHSPYIRILGFRKDKAYILKHITENSKVPVIINIKKSEKHLGPDALRLLNAERIFTDIYSMAAPNSRMRNIGLEYTKPIVIV
ncbi:nucleotidyltransferase [Anaerotignum faecicola]|nr:nucleotidyltransferase [Anaerotignum faecicola]